MPTSMEGVFHSPPETVTGGCFSELSVHIKRLISRECFKKHLRRAYFFTGLNSVNMLRGSFLGMLYESGLRGFMIRRMFQRSIHILKAHLKGVFYETPVQK